MPDDLWADATVLQISHHRIRIAVWRGQLERQGLPLFLRNPGRLLSWLKRDRKDGHLVQQPDSADKIHVLDLREIVDGVIATHSHGKPVKQSVAADHKAAVGFGAVLLVCDPDQLTGPTGLQEVDHADPPCIFDVLMIFSHVGYLL